MADAEAGFGGGVDAPEDDPFAGADLDFSQEDPLGPEDLEQEVTDKPVEGRPIVDGEGQVQQPQAAAAPPADGETQVASEPAKNEELPGSKEDRYVPGAVAAATTAAEVAEAAADPQTAPGDGGQTAPAAAQTGSGSEPSAENPGGAPVHGPEGDQPTVHPDSDAAEAERAAASGSSPETPSDGGGESIPSDPTAPATAEDPNKRAYKIFVPEGEGKFAEVRWFEDKDGKMVAKGTKGAKERSECFVRSKEDALRVGYAALDTQEPASLIVVASSQWKVKKVQPTTEQIPRVRLQIT